METGFFKWHELKSKLQRKSQILYFWEGETRLVHLEKNIGREQNRRGQMFSRPVIVFRKFDSESFIAIPLTSKHKIGKFFFPIPQLQHVHFGTALLSQIRVIDQKRLIRKMGVLPKNIFQELHTKIGALLLAEDSSEPEGIVHLH